MWSKHSRKMERDLNLAENEVLVSVNKRTALETKVENWRIWRIVLRGCTWKR